MRKFSSYGPIVNTSEFYAPREELIEKTYSNLVGENPQKGAKLVCLIIQKHLMDVLNYHHIRG